ncbi:hypothetical protein H5410_008386, partial [Solanum commersonii]
TPLEYCCSPVTIRQPKSFFPANSLKISRRSRRALYFLGVNLTDVDLLEFLQQLADTDGSSIVPHQ